MAGTNEILTFAQGGAANIMPQTDYAALSARNNGFQSGVAQSNQVNKVIRQASFMARVLSQWAVDTTGGSILDNGDEANAKALLSLSVQTLVNAILGVNNYATVPQLTAQVATLLADINNEAVLRAQADAAGNQARANADTAEAATRFANDQSEANTRYANDQAILAMIANFATNAQLAAEANARAAGIDVEAVTRNNQDVALVNNYTSLIATEQSARSAGDAGLRSYVDATFPPFSAFPALPNGNGVWTRTPGCLIQAGRTVLATGAGDTVLFPTTFPNFVWNIVASDWGDGDQICGAVILNNSSFTAYARNPATAGAAQPGTFFGYLAIGN